MDPGGSRVKVEMADELDIENLLHQISLASIDGCISNMWREAECLWVKGQPGEAIARALDAKQLALRARNETATGIAFLYIAAARRSSAIDSDWVRATSDAGTAIAWLNRDDHNSFIAHSIQARLFEEQENWPCAAENYHRAVQTLGRLVKAHRRRGDLNLATQYDHWRVIIQEAIDRLEAFALAPRWPQTSTVTHQVPNGPNLGGLQPARTLPPPARRGNLLELMMIPIYRAHAHAGDADEVFEEPAEDYLDIDQFTIQGHACRLRLPASKMDGGDVVRLQRDREYIVVEVKGDSMEPVVRDGEFVLVRRQPEPDHDGQIGVLHIGAQNAGDSVRNIVKRLRRDRGGVWLESENDRYPRRPLTNEEVLGVVVGVFTPVADPKEK